MSRFLPFSWPYPESLASALLALVLPGSLAADLVDSVNGIEFPLKWETYVGLTTFRSTILYKDGTIVIGSNGEHYGGLPDARDGLYILDARSGRVLRQLRGSEFGDTDVNGVAWYRDRLIFGDDNGSVFAYKLEGEKLWQTDLEGDIEGCPALADLSGDYYPEAVVATESGWVHVLDGRNGDIVWSVEVGMDPAENKYGWLQSKSFMASPALYDLNGDGTRDVLIGSRNASFYAFDGRNGEQLWRYDTFSGIHASALVTTARNDLRILFAEAYSGIHFLDRTGRRRGEGELEAPGGGIQGFYSSPVITSSGSVLIGSSWFSRMGSPEDDGFWVFHPFSSSREARKFAGAGGISATPILADMLDEFYPQIGVVTESGMLWLVYPTGEIAAAFELPAGAEATPLVADIDGDGKHELLIATRDQFLRCYDTPSTGRIVWGQFRGNNHNTGVMDDVINETVPKLQLVERWISTHPKIAGVIFGYGGVFLLALLLYIVQPLALLKVDGWIQKMEKLPLPATLTSLRTPLAYLLLVRLFSHRPRVLDSWIRLRLTEAGRAFESRATVQSRRIHVQTPAVLDGKTVAQLSASDLHPAFLAHRTIISVTGEGGSGKTSLACQIARDAMSLERSERLNPSCPMIPLLLEPDQVGDDAGESPDLVTLACNQLARMLDEELGEATALVKHLLKQKRLLLVIDGVSEMGAEVRRELLPLRADYPAGAVIVTSRITGDLQDTRSTTVETLRIEGTRLSSFMEAYLIAAGERRKFDDSEFFAACGRLSELVGDRDITVLLAKMYADLVVALKTQTLDADILPQTVPDLMLGYLRVLNGGIQEDRISNRAVQEYAERIAWESVRATFQPLPINRNRLYQSYPENEDIDAGIDYLEKRLRLLSREGAAATLLRFSLDPLAEYLAAQYLVDEYGNNEDRWREFLSSIADLDLKDPKIHGFFRALFDCCHANTRKDAVPAFLLEELKQRLAESSEDPNGDSPNAGSGLSG